MLTTVASTLQQFCMQFIKLLQKTGYQVDVVCNFEEGNNISDERIKSFKNELTSIRVNYRHFGFSRNALCIGKHIESYKELKKYIEQQQYDFIHCHTPIAGAIGRLAAHKTKTKIIYTAHGFHFYNGAPNKNWCIFYPVEWLCAHWTDILITINLEDYALAQKKLKAKQVVYVPGVGIDLSIYGQKKVDKMQIRKYLGLPYDSVMLLSVGELNENKNHRIVIEALKGLPENVHYVIAGIDKLDGMNQKLAQEIGIKDRVHFLGYKINIAEICAASDIYVFPSFREGLSVSLMEAMASGLPCVVSRIRGNTDLIDNNGGVLFNPTSIDECSDAIVKVLNSNRQEMGLYNAEKVKKFSVETVVNQMREIYSRL